MTWGEKERRGVDGREVVGRKYREDREEESEVEEREVRVAAAIKGSGRKMLPQSGWGENKHPPKNSWRSRSFIRQRRRFGQV